jgi:hypothetical protein
MTGIGGIGGIEGIKGIKGVGGVGEIIGLKIFKATKLPLNYF